jgi:hypothetical protein
MADKRYKTKAAKFYKMNLAKHVEVVAAKGCYEGREANRRENNAQPTNGDKRPSLRRRSFMDNVHCDEATSSQLVVPSSSGH